MKISVVILREAIRRTAFAITTEQKRFSIAGAKLLIDETSLKMVATDGHRLAYTSFPLVNQTQQKLDLLVPKKTLAQLEDLLDREIRRDPDGIVEISDEGNQLCFIAGNHQLFSRQLSGTFPNYEMVLPKNLVYAVEISTEDFRASLSRVTVTSETKNYTVAMKIEPGKLQLKSGSAEAEAQEEMLAVLMGESTQNTHTLNFNSRYVLDFLQVVGKAESPTFMLGFNDGTSAFELFLPDQREGFRYVLMPLRG